MRLWWTYRTASIGPLHLGKTAHFSVEHVHLLHQTAQSGFSGFTDLLINPLRLCGVQEKEEITEPHTICSNEVFSLIHGADLIVVQRRVIAQSTDGRQLDQSIILSTFDGHAMLCTRGKPETDLFGRRMFFDRPLHWFALTYTSPSGVYFEPEMSNWARETLSPSTLSMMNI